jgi:hypothetical protein
MMRRRKKNKMSSSLLRKVELIYPKRGQPKPTKGGQKESWLCHKGKKKKKRLLVVRFKFRKEKVILKGKPRKC